MKPINCISIFLLFTILMSPSVRCAEPDPTLSKVEKELRKAFADIASELSFEHSKDEKSLYLRYKSRKFMVHRHTMRGEISAKAYEREGPSYEGIFLRVDIQKAGSINQAKVPQTVREPYWMTYVDVTPVEGTEIQLFWVMSYGSRTSPKQLKILKDYLKSFKEKGEQKR